MPKPLVIPKWQYFNPSKENHRNLKRFLKYVAFRENAEHFELEEHDKWTDAGLGSCFVSELMGQMGRLR